MSEEESEGWGGGQSKKTKVLEEIANYIENKENWFWNTLPRACLPTWYSLLFSQLSTITLKFLIN